MGVEVPGTGSSEARREALRVLIRRDEAMETRRMSMRSSGGKRGAMEVRKAVCAVRVGVVVGRSFRKRRSLPAGCQRGLREG